MFSKYSRSVYEQAMYVYFGWNNNRLAAARPYNAYDAYDTVTQTKIHIDLKVAGNQFHPKHCISQCIRLHVLQKRRRLYIPYNS